MVSLQPKLNLRISQRQVLTPGLMQMVSVLALNKIELKDLIEAEITENPVLEELENTVPILDHVAGREADRELASTAPEAPDPERTDPKADPFEEIDFGSYFQEYLDPGFRSPQSFELNEKPSIENFLTVPGSLVDHLRWQIGSLPLSPLLREAVEYVLGNLDEDGYCATASGELHMGWLRELRCSPALLKISGEHQPGAEGVLREALSVVHSLDPVGVGAADLRECLLLQIEASKRMLGASVLRNGFGHSDAVQRMASWTLAHRIVDNHLPLLQKRDLRELGKAAQATPEQVNAAFDCIRTLDPRPGQRFNHSNARLIEPDVSFIRRDDEWIAVMDDENVPTLRLNRDYRKLLQKGEAGKEVKDYVKERYRSALQLMRNIEQRKNTILRTCEAIVRRQGDFLENGVERLKPMMIKDVAEEIGVHPSTVSRAVSNKYVHTPQGVFELRFFFSEGVSGPEGSGTPLLLLKRRVKKLIEEEDAHKPLTDDHITLLLQKDGIDVTRRTVAKYREDMRIPSTHQRRIR